MSALEGWLAAYAVATTAVLLRVAYQDYKRRQFQQEIGSALTALARRGEDLLRGAERRAEETSSTERDADYSEGTP